MAEKMKDWQSTIVWGIVLIFFGGMAYKTLEIVDAKTVSNAKKIEEVDSKVDRNVERIHKNELVQTEINAKLNDIPEIKKKLEKLAEHLMQYEYERLNDGKKASKVEREEEGKT